MKIVIVGAGFTGLTAGYKLLREGHQVTILEKENQLGGLATGYTRPGWKWHLDRAYHHLFTNDQAAIDLAQQVGQKLERITPKTCVYIDGKIVPFDSPISLLRFPYLDLIAKLRTAAGIVYLKLVNNYRAMENTSAIAWVRQIMGEESYRTIWEPLFRGKFHEQANRVMLPWFWARIKKRTQALLYPTGGFTGFMNKISDNITSMKGTILLNIPVTKIEKKSGGYRVITASKKFDADRILYTGPTVGFPYLFGRELVPVRKPHQYLTAQILILRMSKSFLKDTYWLNITDQKFPFLVLVDHTNFVKPKYYNGNRIVYIGNYLPAGHELLKLTKSQLLKKFSTYLEQIKPGFRRNLIGTDMFTLPYAQGVVNSDYVENMKLSGTGMPGVFMANIDSVYPWDRGTNYAIEKGLELADQMLE